MVATPAFAGVFEELFVTRDTLGARSDRKQPAGRNLWMSDPVWTIAEHVYDKHATRENG